MARAWRWLAVASILATLGMALWIYTSQELGADGYLSTGLALGPPSDTLRYLINDQHPPLYYLALRGWFDLAGRSFLQARWLSIASVLIGEAAFFALVRSLAGGRAAGLATVVLATCPAVVAVAATVRDYSMGIGLSLLALLVTLRAARRPAVWIAVAAAVLNAAALLTWYFHVAVLVACVALLIVERRGRRTVAAALAGAGALCLPWLFFTVPVLLQRAAAPQAFGAPRARAPVISEQLNFLTQFAFGELPGHLLGGNGAIVVGVLWLALAAAGVSLSFRGKRGKAGGTVPEARSESRLGHAERSEASVRRSRIPRCARNDKGIPAGLLGAAGLAVGLAMFVFLRSVWATDASGRYLLVALPFAFLLQALAVARGWLAVGWLWLLLCAGSGGWEFWRVHSLPPLPWGSDPVLAYIESSAQPNDAVFFYGWGPYSRYLLRGKGAARAVALDVASPAQRSHMAGQLAPLVASLQGAQHIWFLNEHFSDTAGSQLIDASLDSTFYFVGQQTIQSPVFDGQAVVREYASGASLQPHAINARLGSVELAQASYPPVVHTGDVLPLDLRWQAGSALSENYSVFVHFVAESGRMVAQHDGWPVAGMSPTSQWRAGETIDDKRGLLIPKDAAPGRYTLTTGMYVGARRLAMADGTNAVDLGQVTVAG